MKVRETCIDSNITLASKNGSVNLSLNMLIDKICNVSNKSKIIIHKNFEIVLDVPHSLMIYNDDEDYYSSIIRSIKIDGACANIHTFDDATKQYILSKLPGNILTSISSYLQDIERKCELFPGRADLIDKISIDLYNYEPFYLIKSLFSDHTLNYCRDVFISLSRMSSQVLLQSTPSDITYYIAEINKSKESDTGKMNTIQ
jgi:hypothetical protein